MIQQSFPELAGRLHLPHFAEVVAARETPKGGEICDEFRPVYAVDVQVLDEYGEPDPAFPVLKDLPLPIPVSGHEMGMAAFPENGAWVEIGFAYGSPNKPFIRTILPHGRSQFPVERGEMRLQQSAGSYQTIDKDGNHSRVTDGNMTDASLNKTSTAKTRTGNYETRATNVDTQDTETIGGIKKIPGSRYFCESFYGPPSPTSGKNDATAYACGGPSRPGHSIATQQGVAHMLSNDSTRFRKACIFTSQAA